MFVLQSILLILWIPLNCVHNPKRRPRFPARVFPSTGPQHSLPKLSIPVERIYPFLWKTCLGAPITKGTFALFRISSFFSLIAMTIPILRARSFADFRSYFLSKLAVVKNRWAVKSYSAWENHTTHMRSSSHLQDLLEMMMFPWAPCTMRGDPRYCSKQYGTVSLIHSHSHNPKMIFHSFSLDSPDFLSRESRVCWNFPRSSEEHHSKAPLVQRDRQKRCDSIIIYKKTRLFQHVLFSFGLKNGIMNMVTFIEWFNNDTTNWKHHSWAPTLKYVHKKTFL